MSALHCNQTTKYYSSIEAIVRRVCLYDLFAGELRKQGCGRMNSWLGVFVHWAVTCLPWVCFYWNDYHIFALALSQSTSAALWLEDTQKAAWSKFFNVIILPFEEHQAFESMGFHQLSNFWTPPYCVSTALPVKWGKKYSCVGFIIIIFFFPLGL